MLELKVSIRSISECAKPFDVTTGTRVLLEESQRQGVKIFVYTSSASVVFNGLFDIKNGDETLPYPEKVTATPSP